MDIKLNKSDIPAFLGIGGFLGGIVVGMVTFLLGFVGLIPSSVAGLVFGGCVVTSVASLLGMFVFYASRLKRLPQRIRQLGNPTKSQSALNQLLISGSRAVPLLIEALSSPAMSMSGTGMESWDGNLARRKAAEGLGQLKAVEAVEPLMETLSDADVSTRATSIGALAKIGDVRAVPALIPLLGDAESVGLAKRTVSDFAADALDKLGQTEVALAFLQTLEGDKTAMETLKSTHRREVIQGLVKAAKSSRQPDEARINALRALGDLNAVEVLPELRLGLKLITLGEIMGRVSSARVREVCEQTISQLEAIQEATGTLPRPAESAAPDVETLPRPANAPDPDVKSFPRPAHEPEPNTDTLPRPADE